VESLKAGGLRPSVGLEIHARLVTRRKLFCGCPSVADAVDNSAICPVCMGLPGTLPVFNEDVLEPAVRLGLALGCAIQPVSRFDRKHYFYPDLPRNFQITQLERPLGLGGLFAIPRGDGGDELRVRIRRIHLEEDAGRLAAGPVPGMVGVDLNRAGAPLVEIVTEPDLDDGAAARAWVLRLRQLMVHLGVCDGAFESGSLRCDANVGFVAREGRGGAVGAGAWTELKNLNSPGAIQRAVDHEIARLSRRIGSLDAMRRETRAWDAAAARTVLLRVKEGSPDYRYFREPDLPDVVLQQAWIADQAARLPESPLDRERRWRERWGLAAADAAALGREPAVADYFEAVASALAGEPGGVGSPAQAARLAARWVLTEILAFWQGVGIDPDPCPVPAGKLASLLGLLAAERISGKAAKGVLEALRADPEADPPALVRDLGLEMIVDPDRIRTWCREVIAAHPAEAASLASGKTGLLEFLAGRVLAKSEGRASPPLVKNILRALISR